LQEKEYTMKITDLNQMRERITSLCAEIDGNADLFHRVHPKFVKRIQFALKIMEIMLKILFIYIRIE